MDFQLECKAKRRVFKLVVEDKNLIVELDRKGRRWRKGMSEETGQVEENAMYLEKS